MTRRRLRLLLPVLLLVVLGFTGVRNAPGEFRQAATGGQRFAAATELGYGVLSWIALAALWKGSRWTRLLMIVWATLLTVCAAVAAVAWGGAGLGAAAVAGVSVAAVAALAVWLAGPGRRADEDSAAGSA
jgi:peptidoglycan/LPS O-acetylase OafA/YrhL